MNTKYFRDHDGWNAVTEIEIEGGRQLVIRTGKRGVGGGLATNATVWTIEADGTRRHSMGFGAPGGDYSERLVLSQPGRITEKQVRQQHERTLGLVPVVVKDVQTFYATQGSMQAQGAGHAALAV